MGPKVNDKTPRDFHLIESKDVDLRTIAQAFDGARLTQARVLAEFTKGELAENLAVSPAAVGQYESGIAKPRATLLPTLSKLLKVPVEYFASGRPLGRLDASSAHFRSLRSTRLKDRAKASAHAEQLWELTYALEKRVRLPNVNLPIISEGTSPVIAAQKLREEWAIGRGPISHLVATMESHGIVTSLIPMANEAIRRVSAYSTDALGRPMVIVTPEESHSIYRYRFTCAHELGHLALHSNPLPGDRQQEREADEFAAEFLTPRAEIGPMLPRSIRFAELNRLSNHWGVSIKSLIWRMGELHLVSDLSVRRAYQRLNAAKDSMQVDSIAMYKGEIPSLLREAFNLAERHGLTKRELANELCWTSQHLSELLGEEDHRPILKIVQ